MRVRAAGGVLWRPGADGAPEVAVVHRPRYDDWSLPKGKLDPGEHPLEAAVREVEEETGCRGTAGPWLGRSAYEVLATGRRVPKTVDWWPLRYTGGRFTPGPEVDELRWVSCDDARPLLTAGRDAEVLDAFGRLGAAHLPLVLLRHARAGSRREWPGADAERPLDEQGRADAAQLAGLLVLLGVRAVLSAPPLRCRQTAQPLADALGVPVAVEPLLGDAGQAADPEGAAALVRSLPPGTVACSQGDALRGLLAGVGARARTVAKGAAAVLWRDGAHLLADDDLDPGERG